MRHFINYSDALSYLFEFVLMLIYILLVIYKMEENVQQQANQPKAQIPQSNPKPFKPPVSNNTSNNKLIYQLYLRREYIKCLALMGKSQGNEFHLYVTGLINRQQLNLEKALELFKQCHMMDKLNFEYLKEISKTMYLLGKFKSSFEAANEAAKIRKDWEIYFLFGKIASALGSSEDAVNNYLKSIELQQNEESYIQLAKEYITGRRFQKAHSLLKDAAKFSQQNSTIYEMMGQLAVRIGKNAEAAVDFETALENDPFNFNSLLGAGSLLQDKNEIDQAVVKYKYALTISPNSASLWNNIGMSFFEKRKYIAAYTCLKKSLYLDPFQWKGYANLGMVCIELQKYMSAFVNFNMAIAQNPREANLFMLLGVSLCNLKDYVNAEKAYVQSLSLAKDGNCYINYALLMLKKKDYARAKEILNEAYQLDSGSTLNLDKETISRMITLTTLQQQHS